jgi:ATP-dependent DNA helicase DinG
MEQSLLFVPDGLPEPNDPAFVDKIAPTLRELITITEGRALCLFTSHRNMNRAYDLLRRQVGYRCLVQGEMGRGALLRAFREDLHSVLFATASFWEGVDVQGEALSLVIIDKLPFASPGDPVVRARSRMIDDAGGNAFSDYQVPSAIVALKQGFGRLIRHRNDTGIVAILDHRLITKSYGKRFINSLPRARRTQEISVVRAWWQRRNGGAV